jgi:hypothetical protein
MVHTVLFRVWTMSIHPNFPCLPFSQQLPFISHLSMLTATVTFHTQFYFQLDTCAISLIFPIPSLLSLWDHHTVTVSVSVYIPHFLNVLSCLYSSGRNPRENTICNSWMCRQRSVLPRISLYKYCLSKSHIPLFLLLQLVSPPLPPTQIHTYSQVSHTTG